MNSWFGEYSCGMALAVACLMRPSICSLYSETNITMINPSFFPSKMTTAVLCALTLLASNVAAQESAYADLDSCVKSEQVTATAKGAAVGALTGLGASLFGGMKKNDAIKATALGALAGGGIGFVKAYYEATNTCYSKNPGWVPASNITRSATLAQAKKAAKYKPSEGIKTSIMDIDMPESVQSGTASIPMNTKFTVLTPDDAETPVEISRKIYIIENGKEDPMPFTAGKSTEVKTFEPAQHTDTVNFPLSSDFKPGMKLRYEIQMKTEKTPVVSKSKTVTII
ncbi:MULTISPECIES: hypothetical protein [unclassified Janthinobacterium]|uniref:hypothetical protein n=1 Tax=unclassified Janthinobacterium TaxID=2610881 RepID=UPI001622781A|nr:MULTISPECIES: hypothetical protein [unclassified Janthinobacterium]MBB5609106.1 hypothetical protein [Janthinobacterium sp. S3T4]MBB5614163.1 hypothetical protein [Janthinobacterium sp. S3M3]